MSKLFVAVLAFSTVSLTVGHLALSLDLFLNNPEIKPLSNPGVKSAYRRDDTNYEDLAKALAALQEPATVAKVKEVLKGHAPKLYQRVEAAEKAFEKVRDSIGNSEAKNFVAQVGEFLDKYYVLGMLVNEQAKEGERLHMLIDALSDEAKKVVGEKLKEALEAVVKALHEH